MRVPGLDPTRVPEPQPGRALDLVVNGGWRLPVRALGSAVEGDVELEPALSEARMPGGLRELPAVLEWRSPLGLVRRPGLLVPRPGGGFLLTGDRAAMVHQRRDHARVRCAVRVLVDPGEGEELMTRTVDLSVGGMLVEHAATLPLGAEVRVVLALGDEDLEGHGVVVRETPFGHRAVAFGPWGRAAETRLARFVFAQEREGRSAAAYAAG